MFNQKPKFRDPLHIAPVFLPLFLGLGALWLSHDRLDNPAVILMALGWLQLLAIWPIAVLAFWGLNRKRREDWVWCPKCMRQGTHRERLSAIGWVLILAPVPLAAGFLNAGWPWGFFGWVALFIWPLLWQVALWKGQTYSCAGCGHPFPQSMPTLSGGNRR